MKFNIKVLVPIVWVLLATQWVLWQYAIRPQIVAKQKAESTLPRFTVGSKRSTVIASMGPPREIDYDRPEDTKKYVTMEKLRYYNKPAVESEDDHEAMTDSSKSYVDTVYIRTDDNTVYSYINHTGNLRVK